jgi:hypothetical protein
MVNNLYCIKAKVEIEVAGLDDEQLITDFIEEED